MFSKRGRVVNLSGFSRGNSQKKGAAHIEMVAAFILFFTFVLFMILILKPYDTVSISGSVVSGMYDQFESMSRTNLTNVFLKANVSAGWVGETCFKVVLPDNIFSYRLSESIVTNLADVRSSSTLNGNNLNVGSPRWVYYKVAISPDFNHTEIGPCTLLENYTLGSVLERQIISSKKVLEMKNRYFNDYDNFRRDLGVPEDFDFAITSSDIPELDMMGLSPTVDTVQTNEYLAEVLLTNGTVVNARFLLWTW
jgi:hypothetical protein